MDEENENEYIQQLEKLMSSEVKSTFWAPTMDILVIATFDNLIEAYRISFKAQRFFQIEQSQHIQTLCFSPDSQLIAYSLLDGSTKIIKTQTGEKVMTVEGLGCDQILNLNFVPFCKVQPQDFMPFCKNSIEARLIPSISPHKNCNKNAIIKINYFNQLIDDFTCLLLTEKQKTWLLLNGFIPIACVDYQKYFQNQPFRALSSHLTKNKLYSVVAKEVNSTYQLSLLTMDAEGIMKKAGDVVKVNCLVGNISQILIFIDTTYSALEAATRDIIRQYNSKINLIDDCSSPDISPCQELMRYLTIGLTSPTLTNFFTKEVYDSKVLQKLDETLTSLFAHLHDVIIESVQNGLERAYLLSQKLLNFCKSGNKYWEFGLKEGAIEEVQEMIRRLYILGEMLLVESTQAKFNIRNLIVWLNKATIKSSQENQTQIENSKSFLNKYTVDYTRLFKFLSEESTFKLENLLIFFRKTLDSKPMIIPQSEFRILNKMRTQNKPLTAQQLALERELGVQDIEIEETHKMESEYSFRSLNAEMKDLLKRWKQLGALPVDSLGKQVWKSYKVDQIGTVEISEMFDFVSKSIKDKEDRLLFYYIEQGEVDKLIKYDCQAKHKSYLFITKYHILSFAVAQDIICVLEEKATQKKIIAQIGNEAFNGEEIQIGRRIESMQGDLQVDSSWRGLNSLVVDKTKLVIFD